MIGMVKAASNETASSRASADIISPQPNSTPRPSPGPCEPAGAWRTVSHWVLNVVFHDDLARLRTANGPRNMAVIKHMNLNLIRNPKDKHSLKTRRKLANLNPDYLEFLIRQPSLLT